MTSTMNDQADGRTALPKVGLSYKEWALFFTGFIPTSMALSSGFIWAYQGRTWPVFVAAFIAWTGYLVAHYGATGVYIDGDADSSERREARCIEEEEFIPEETWRRAGIITGVSTLVAGMVIGVVFIRQENHLMTNLGGILFLGGYVIAHYAETDLLL